MITGPDMAFIQSPVVQAVRETIMRFAPAAAALSLLVAVSASVGYGAPRQADPRAIALVTEGQAALAGGNVDHAIDAFEAALAVDPAHVPVFLDLAEASRRQGLQGKAIRYYREALDRDPGNVAAISGEGAALVEKGAVEKARRNLAKLESLCGGSCDATRQLAAAIARGPQTPVMTAEAAMPDTGVAQN